MSAKPFFIVSSGRSGTAMLHKALSANTAVDMNHEYAVQITQPLAVRRYLDLCDSHEAQKTLAQTHIGAIAYSAGKFWGDSSNKLSWLIAELAQLLPNAKFVHLVRDGRKVAGSYFRKLSGECYDDASTRILQAHYDDPTHTLAPPPEKKYWWPMPRRSDPLAQEFRGFDQFERMCWHWAEVNRVILEALSVLPAQQQLFIRLEDLRSSPDTARALYDFLNLPYRDADFSAFKKPHNVNRPEDRVLDASERRRFEPIAQPMMQRLGYAEIAEYVVNY